MKDQQKEEEMILDLYYSLRPIDRETVLMFMQVLKENNGSHLKLIK